MAERGITLVALVITIIVLLILAGVSISLVVGNNGVLTQATNAVEKNREAQAREEVEMAWASATTDYWNDWTKNSSTVTTEGFYQAKLNDYLAETKAADQPVGVTGNGDGTYTVTYKAKDQGIVYTFLVSGDGKVEKKTGVILNKAALSLEPTETETLTAELVELEGTITWASDTPAVATVSNGVVTAVANGTAKITATCGTKSATCNVKVASKLASVVNIGDYVNINVGYTDQKVSSTSYTTTGWRVLSKNTTTGVVRLISTGHPLTFYHPYVDDSTSGATSVTMLKEIEGGSITQQATASTRGYQASGFTPQNMSGIFSNTSIFSGISLPVQADFSSIGTDNNLRTTGQAYWLGESSGYYVYLVNSNGNVSSRNNYTLAVRPVVSLVSGVTVKDGAGTTASPYRLNEITY